MLRFRKKCEATDTEGDIFGISYAFDGSFIGCALSSGHISLYSGSTGRLSYTLEHNKEHLPVTSIRFHPTQPKFFVTASSDGSIINWNIRKSEIIWTIREENNQIFALDLNKTGELVATAGLDTKIRLYDYKTQNLISVFEKSQEADSDIYPGHTNRVFSVIFDPDDSNLMYSAGWDDTIQVWDKRVKGSVHSLFGSHVCSDSLSIFNKKIAAGSWRTRDQLQLWDMRTLTVEKTFTWKSKKHCLVYATRFSKDGQFIFAGGSGSNEFAAFSVSNGSQVCDSLVMKNTVFAIGLSADGKEISIGEGKGRLCTYTIN
ncbi:WD repeat protein [Tritrichomonas foetus]|uniref:WD repeat protein n=1 Tax=Tritrichomonas foetus TaxID=1144522 RepID=A0A1J4KCQ1_9EUKA|nr:WD repeat protein [Tritrichomonas foetus]|eukprot:OHT07476.1 WD repeat protein [Tritrichomonas foetus]